MKVLFTILLVLFSSSVFSAEERYTDRIEGTSVFPGAILELYDDKYFDMNTNLLWTNDYTNYKVSNKITLGLNRDVLQMNTFSSGTVTLKIISDTWSSTGFVQSFVMKTLVVSNNLTPLSTIDDLSSYIYSGAHKIRIEVTAVTGLSAGDIFIESEINVERYYTFDGASVSGTSIAVIGTNSDYLDFSWNSKKGAEFYELEYVHINDYTLVPGTYITSLANLKFNYYLNSTRVSVKANHYTIPKIFDHGYVLFRVRAIGKQGTTFSSRKDGVWNVAESGTLSVHPTSQLIAIGAEYDHKMNWSFQVGFAEEGKRMEMVSFADGLGRGRQSVAHNTNTKQAIVSNVYYDELGRPVISDLPTPVDGEQLKHYIDFNRANVAGDPTFNKDYFDSVPPTDSCNVYSRGFSLNYGAGKYYSPNNPDKLDENANIPDAEHFPYSRVTYLDDYSGRVVKVGGAGKDLKVGAGHESRFVYPSSNQVELDKLFGTEVGIRDHYQKMITLDANGQVYVQYSDMAGRVVASYMAGEAPANVEPLTDALGAPTLVKLIDNGSGQAENLTPPSPEAPYSSLTFDEYIYSNGTYKFTYGFTPEQYATSCMASGICFDCVYDLELKITDDCGLVIWNETKTINGGVFDAICNGATTYQYEDDSSNAFKELSLLKGKYNIYKKLSVNQHAIDEYWCFYVENNTCLPSISSNFNTEYAVEEFAECNAEDTQEEVQGDCDGYREVMLSQVSPSGQYGHYTSGASSYTCTDPTSVFYTGTFPPLTGNWQTANYAALTIDPATLFIDGVQYTSPSDLTLKQYVDNFDDSWAPALLPFHPEICYLNFCYLNGASNAYNASMLAQYSFEGAKGQGFFRPLDGLTIPSASFFEDAPAVLNFDPFFSINGVGTADDGLGLGFSTTMKNTMEHYIHYPLTGGGSIFISMWQYAVLEAFPPDATHPLNPNNLGTYIDNILNDPCLLDLVWINFREAYLQAKAELYYQAQQAYAEANGCSNACIGVSIPCSGGAGYFADKISVFGNVEQFGAAATSLTSFTTYTDALITTGCQTSCEQYANEWIATMNNCEQYTALSLSNQAKFKDSLIALCMKGCDNYHPTGSSTAPAGSGGFQTIAEVMAGFFGASYEDNMCTSLLISEPEPYRPYTAMMSSLEAPLDLCACTKMEQAVSDYHTDSLANTLPVGVTNAEQMLAYTLGISMNDIDNLLCICRDAVGQTPSAPASGWTLSSSGSLINSNYLVPNELGCGESSSTGCLDCAVMQQDVANLLAEFPAYATLELFQQAENYQTILTNYMNNTHFFTLSYTAYANFLAGCNATTTSPYCTVNPVMNEWSEMMKLIAFRGELLSTSALPVHLLTENIVYKHGELQNTFTGNDYWSDTTGNTIDLHFGTSSSNCVITLTKPTDLQFSDIISFGTITPLTGTCGVNNTFEVEIQYMDCGVLTLGVLQGISGCLAVSTCICGDTGQLLCNEIPNQFTDVCYQPRLDEMYQNAIELYEQDLSGLYANFTLDYNAKCSEAFSTENLAYEGLINTYQYTLFYYDQAGNLIKTIAPEGVDLGYSATPAFSLVDEDREALISNVPDHHYQTEYVYNSYNQLVATTNPDQEGTTKFWYDRYGRITASQNPVQALESKFSYSLYDKPGRPIEVGQVITTIPTSSILNAIDAIPGESIANWVYAGTRSEVTKTQYDEPFSSSIASKFANGQQENLRLRVASVFYYENGTDVNYTSAIHYSYDIHGNIFEQLQDVPMMAQVAQDVKSTQYDFELISGNVSKVSYQKGKPDYIAHTYDYDELNRLTEVHTTTNDVHKTQEAHYRYYDYGPMARTEIGEYKVQGMDYAYTINGWLKGMNASTLDINRDMGKDGVSPSTGSGGSTSFYLPQNKAVHEEFARDVLGYTLGYFENDYKAIGASTMEADYSGTNLFNQGSTNLYNGNIRNIVTSIQGMATMGTAYKYDQLQRLKEMQAFYNGTFGSNSWAGSTQTDDYYNSYEYDRNGNISHLKRNGVASIGLLMDDFAYNYKGLDELPNATSSSKSNRLDFVNDSGLNDAANTGDIKTGMLTGNYTYDAIGELTADATEGISNIEWRRGDKKVKKMTRSNSNSSEVEFIYNPFGQRIVKIVKPRTSGVLSPQTDWNYSYYSFDANGQVMAIYDATISSTVNTADLEERNIYGSGRIGILKEKIPLFDGIEFIYPNLTKFQNTLGDRQYEITNHLGSVNAVINDRKSVDVGGTSSTFIATLIQTSDFYPFGMILPERHHEYSSDKYRFSFQNMELDNEVKGDGNSYTTEFRQFDPRLGRWLSLDPLMSMFPDMSPYVAFDNNPVLYNDPLGLAVDPPVKNPTTGEDWKADDEWTDKETGDLWFHDGKTMVKIPSTSLGEVTVTANRISGSGTSDIEFATQKTIAGLNGAAGACVNAETLGLWYIFGDDANKFSYDPDVLLAYRRGQAAGYSAAILVGTAEVDAAITGGAAAALATGGVGAVGAGLVIGHGMAVIAVATSKLVAVQAEIRKLEALNYGSGTESSTDENGESSTGSSNQENWEYDDFEQARNSAVNWLEENGFKADVPVLGKFGSNKGKPIGYKTADGKVGFRVEFDKRSGGHINVWSGKTKGPHITFKNGTEEMVNKIVKRYLKD